jgi:hypothetical protein
MSLSAISVLTLLIEISILISGEKAAVPLPDGGLFSLNERPESVSGI